MPARREIDAAFNGRNGLSLVKDVAFTLHGLRRDDLFFVICHIGVHAPRKKTEKLPGLIDTYVCLPNSQSEGGGQRVFLFLIAMDGSDRAIHDSFLAARWRRLANFNYFIHVSYPGS